MKKLELVLAYLGEPYFIDSTDTEPTILRKLDDSASSEISGAYSGNETYTVYVWRDQPFREILGIYAGIHGVQTLKDVLGHIAFKYQSLEEKIRVEREDPA